MYISSVVTFSFCVLHVFAGEICDGSKHVKWRTDPSDCNVFYFCFGPLERKYHCQNDGVYNEETHKCVEKGSEQDKCTKHSLPVSYAPEDQCESPNTVFLPHDESCSRYIDCSLRSVQECPYPLLFDEDIKRCIQPEKAICGKRIVYKDPCDYEENHCRSSMGCIPCHVRYPSCKGLPNGLNPWTGREGSPYYAVCNNERVVYHDMCDFEKKKEIFHPEKKICEAIYK